MPVELLNASMLNHFVIYLKDKNCSNNTIWIYLMPIKRILRTAQREGLLEKLPFEEFTFLPEKRMRGYLNDKELYRVIKYSPKNSLEERVQVAFLFSCFTGLSYADIKDLTNNHIRRMFDNKLWIIMFRHKTKAELRIKLLPAACQLINEHGNKSIDNVFNVPTNRQCNVVMRRIAANVGINDYLCFHMARHTFATTVTLSKGIPIETVSAMLGYENIKTTQIYANITNKKISDDMAKIARTWSDIC